MYFKKIFFLTLLISFTGFCQEQNSNTGSNKKPYLTNYLMFGFGRLDDYINFGGGLFFPLSEKFMIGIRGNVNTEIVLFKTPSESILDINLSVRYVPVIWNNFVVIAGVGIGCAAGVKRGNLISRPLLIAEEYEKIKFNSLSSLVELEAGYFLTKFVGFSIAGYSVITSRKTIATYQISLFFYGLTKPK
ncbi:MAG: hypothetical protein NZM09_07190 [Ignavibacterium sp.]|nr:hypothetical protein [Ignavibacterium sp.]MDW8375466.1 hypothetical protein [Ignavibacteriales bacterium]